MRPFVVSSKESSVIAVRAVVQPEDEVRSTRTATETDASHTDSERYKPSHTTCVDRRTS